jgi:predicted transposase/invertase (TIGR01784 family)
MRKTVDKPSDDHVFKYIFANEKDKKALMGFIESILEMKEGEIKDIRILNPGLPISRAKDKAGILDVKAVTNLKQTIDIEMQLVFEKDFIKRIVYYNSLLLAQQVKKGERYNKINRTVSIIITNFTLLKDEEYYHNKYQIANLKSGVPLTDLIEYNIVELTKFRRVDMKKIGENEKRKIAWCEFLASDSLEDAVIVTKKYNYAGLASAGYWIDELSKEEKERWVERDILVGKHARKNQILAAKEAGIEEGMYLAAKNLKKAKAGIDMIVEVTGLSKAEIAKL